jgi:hypothetical protein
MWAVSLLLVCACARAHCQAPGTDQAQQQVVSYLAKLADLHCTESVVQEKLSGNGHVTATEKSKFDYLIMMQGDGDGFQLIESRIEASNAQHKPLPMLVTNGFSSLLLIFHPYYRDSFQFESGGDDLIDGRPATKVNFTHITGKRTLAALALRGREYPLEFRGTAWLDKQSGEVVRIDAGLLHEMGDVGLRTLAIHVEYKPTRMGINAEKMTLPALAVVDVETPKQHWRNTHVFSAYKSFSAEAEQDPNVKVRPDKSKPADSSQDSEKNTQPKEKQ